MSATTSAVAATIPARECNRGDASSGLSYGCGRDHGRPRDHLRERPRERPRVLQGCAAAVLCRCWRRMPNLCAPARELAAHPSDDQHLEMYLMCDDIQATVNELEAKGVEFTRPVTDAG